MQTRKAGRMGEDAAEAYLKNLNFEIIGKNYFTKGGEIDIIFRDADAIVFAEVKYRTGSKYGTPAEAVTRTKMRRITVAATDYLFRNKLMDAKCRFDVIEVFGPELSVRHITNAFEAVCE